MARRRARLRNRFDVDQARVEETGWTIQFIAACLSGTAYAGAIAWAAVQVADRTAWLTLALALIGLLAPPAAWGVIHYRRVQRLYLELKSQIEARDERRDDCSPKPSSGGSDADPPGGES